MVTLSFDDTQILVPQSWSDIRLSDYERWFRTEPKSRIEQVAFVADICNIDKGVLLDNPTQVFDTIVDIVRFVFEEYDGEPQNRIEINDQNFLIAITDELTLAEWVDIESVFERDSHTRLSDILSIMCRPAGEEYDIKTTDGRKLLFRNLTMDKVMPLLAFFLQRKKRSQDVSNLYLEVKEEVGQCLHHIQNFAENGDGIKSLPIWQRIKFYFLMRSLKKQLSKFSDFSSIA